MVLRTQMGRRGRNHPPPAPKGLASMQEHSNGGDKLVASLPLAGSETALLITTSPTDTDEPMIVLAAVGGALSAQLALLRGEARQLALTLIDASQQTTEEVES
jgi:hypothetical protein